MAKDFKKIRTGVVRRAFSVAKLSVKGTVKAGIHQIQSLGLDEGERTARFKKHLIDQAKAITAELTQLKGSLMKGGQLLSTYGEQFLPPEVNEVLKTLQSKSMPLAWDTVSRVLAEQLGAPRLSQLEVEKTAIGSASLGQVHAARIKATGEKIALKVQYPGVEKAIDSDLKLLRRILKAGNWIPFSPGLDAVFEEARFILHQEVDYEKEFAFTEGYRNFLSEDPRFVVPRPVKDFSSVKVLATSFEEGVALDSPEVLGLSQERRNRLALNFFELYLKEIFVFGQVQTDPHFGNYRIRLDEINGQDQIVCLDFGAIRVLTPEFLGPLHQLLAAAYSGDREELRAALMAVRIVQEGDPEEWVNRLSELCLLMTEPVRTPEIYDWGKSDLAARAFKSARNFIFKPTVRLPPPEMLSLDRKSSGVFVVLSKWQAKISTRVMLGRYLANVHR